jgi:PleD family two-component response regulator
LASKTRILIVGEKQDAAQYENMLLSNSFKNISKCQDTIRALQEMEQDPPDIIIVDAELQDMDPFEFAANIREIERSDKRFTYVLVIGDESVGNNVDYSRQANVDAIVIKKNFPIGFIPQVMSGERITLLARSLLKSNAALQERCEQLEPGQLLDPLTGLGNRRQAMSGIEAMVREIEARGGAIALLLIRLDDLADLKEIHDNVIIDEMIVAVGHKIKRLTRPLDIVAYIDTGLFAIVMQHDVIEHCRPESYVRFKTRLEDRSYRVSTGFLQPDVSIGVCGSSAGTGPPKADSLMAVALSNLMDISLSKEISVTILNRL